MRTQSLVSHFGIAGLLMLIAGCSPEVGGVSGGEDPGTRRPMIVEDVRVEIGVGSPIPVDILVSGTWPEACAQLAEVRQSVDGNRIVLTLLATPLDPQCPPDTLGVPFRIQLPINAVELPEGEYQVEVNGVSTSFRWPPSP